MMVSMSSERQFAHTSLQMTEKVHLLLGKLTQSGSGPAGCLWVILHSSASRKSSVHQLPKLLYTCSHRCRAPPKVMGSSQYAEASRMITRTVPFKT